MRTSSGPSEDRVKIASFMQNPHDLDLLHRDVIEDDMRGRQDGAQPWSQFAPRTPLERPVKKAQAKLIDLPEMLRRDFVGRFLRQIDPDCDKIIFGARRPNKFPRLVHDEGELVR